MSKFLKYIWNILQALDRLANTVLAGTDKEYLSSRIYRFRFKSIFIWWCYELLNAIEKDHCEKAFADCQIGMDVNDAVIR